MNKLLVSLVLSLGMAGMATAQEILVGDAEAGAGKVAMCAACHGPDGNSPSADFPKIAGLGERYLYKQLADIKEGNRVAENAELVARGEAIYRGGDLATGLPACTGCHSPTGLGNDPAGYPLLSGQHAKYIATQLTNFREGERQNDGEAMIMQTIASRLSNQDIEAVSAYIQGLR